MNEIDKKLGSFQYQCLKRVLRISWSYIVCIDQLYQKTNSEGGSTESEEKKVEMAGVCSGYPDNTAMHVTAVSGKPQERKVGKPK